MKLYVATTGLLFGAIFVVHIWHATAEPHLWSDPVFWMIDVAAAALAVWAWFALRRSAGR